MDLKQIVKRVIEGEILSKEEALELYEFEDIKALSQAADEIRKACCGDRTEFCTILNAKSGRCSEDCKYCAQSVHYKTGVQEYALIDKESALNRAKENESEGAHRFSLVTSGKGLIGKDFDEIVEIFDYLNKNTNIKLCASQGIVTKEQIDRLKESGVTRYHHNVETSRRFYEKICSTHTYDSRIKTIKYAQEAGIEVCSGGIIGMGETVEDRINMAFELRNLNIKSIPINVLMPICGTPFQDLTPISEEEILRTIAVFRFINPDAYIRYAGGRMKLGDKVYQGIKGGINAALTGNYLTTTGSNIKNDIKMFKDCGFEVK